MIFSDFSICFADTGKKLQTDHHLLIQIQDMLRKIEVDQEEIVFMWVPGHAGIWGNRLLIAWLEKL